MSLRHVLCLTVTALLLSVSGCLSFFHPGAVDRPIDGSYDQVFQATLETLEARGFPIEQADREEGRIKTRKRSIGGIDPYHPVETVEARIQDDEDVSVRLFMTFLTPGPGSSGEANGEAAVEKAVDRGAIYAEYLNAIEDRVRDFRGLADS